MRFSPKYPTDLIQFYSIKETLELLGASFLRSALMPAPISVSRRRISS